MEHLVRQKDLDRINTYLEDGECCSVVGLSNTGKSTLLRTLYPTKGRKKKTREILLFYVDCNRMLDLSEQGFYETVLRTIRSRLHETKPSPQLIERLDQAYQQVIEPRNPLAVPLGFNDAMEGLCETGTHVGLILDEFDEPFGTLEGRTFLNLRALRDRYQEKLIYITATVRTLKQVRSDLETDEFRELFAGHIHQLGMLDEEESRSATRSLAEEEGITLSPEEIDFVLQSAGGHPGLLRGVIRLFDHAHTSAPQTYERMGISLIQEASAGDPVIHSECERLWAQLTPLERQGLLASVCEKKSSKEIQRQLQRLGIVDTDGQVFGETFAAFVRQKEERKADLPWGVWVDKDAGEVYVDGRQTATLTDLEYRLLHILYARKDKLCDKYRLVEEVWGESYIDQVDDARIEKLVSRVRAKIEQDPGNPRYLTTVRGRGYRLLSRPDEPES